jgi:prophage regulatory protein
MQPPIAANDNVKPVKLLNFKQLNSTRGIDFSRQHLHTLESQKKFPARVSLGEHHVGWVESEIDAWLCQRLAARAA